MSGAAEMVAEVVQLRERSQGPMPDGDSGALQQTIRLDAFHVSLQLLVLTQKRVGATLEEILVPVLDLVDIVAADAVVGRRWIRWVLPHCSVVHNLPNPNRERAAPAAAGRVGELQHVIEYHSKPPGSSSDATAEWQQQERHRQG